MIVQDEVLVRDFQNGSDIAFANLYTRYKHAVYVYCLKVLADPEAAKDVVQGSFLKVYERRSQLLHPERFKAWLLMIARNDCLTYARRAGRTTELAWDADNQGGPLPPDEMEKEEDATIVARAVARLKPDLREVVILREYENLSYREIADVVGIPESTVKSRLFEARRQLYDQLKPMFEERR